MLGSASRLAPAPAGTVARELPARAGGWIACAAKWSCDFRPQPGQKLMLVFARQELVEARDGFEQDFRVALIEVGAGQEVSADHLQTIAAGFIRSQHHGRRLNRLLDDRDLALVELEIDD